jgi:hypothetical protein
MRAFRIMASATAAIAGLLLVPAGIASASTTHPAAPSVHLRGGLTRVTTAPGIAPALLESGIVPVPTWPAREGINYHAGVVTSTFSFPVTGGRVTLKPSGYVTHAGGILFIGFSGKAAGKSLKLSRFSINLSKGDLTGIVNGNPKVRVPVFNLSLAHAKLKVGKHFVRATNIALTLTKTAAGALNATFGTKLPAGLGFGTASTTLRF